MARLVSLLALYALVLASVGPALDHHFPERQAGHQHLYLGAAGSDQPHQHLHQLERAHHHPPAQGGRQPGLPSPQPADTVYLADYEGTSLASASSPVPILDALPSPPAAGTNPLHSLAAPDRTLTATSVAPLERPPLA